MQLMFDGTAVYAMHIGYFAPSPKRKIKTTPTYSYINRQFVNGSIFSIWISLISNLDCINSIHERLCVMSFIGELIFPVSFISIILKLN